MTSRQEIEGKGAKMGRIFLAGLLVLFTCLPVHAQTNELREAAREPLQRGLGAAQQQAWEVAVRHFLAAQKEDPEAPQILFNLGLASSKIPGHELRSLAWLKAYLLAAPKAQNEAAVKSLIVSLETRAEITISKAIAAIQPSIVQQKSLHGSIEKLLELAAIRAQIGDLVGAKQNAASGYLEYHGSEAYFIRDYIYGLSRHNDLLTVDSVIESFSGRYPGQVRLLSNLNAAAARGRVDHNDLYGAQRYAKAVRDPWPRRIVYMDIACKAKQAGDIPLVKSALLQVRDAMLETHKTMDMDTNIIALQNFLILVEQPEMATSLASNFKNENYRRRELSSRVAEIPYDCQAYDSNLLKHKLIDHAKSGYKVHWQEQFYDFAGFAAMVERLRAEQKPAWEMMRDTLGGLDSLAKGLRGIDLHWQNFQ